MSGKEVSRVDVDPNGDVLLELSDLGGRTHLQVSSSVLSLSSPVFAKMLASQFKEGLNGHHSSGTPYAIPLPDENVEAFVLLCNVIHFRKDLVPRKPTLTCLENFAVICDKWDFTSAIAASSEIWLQNWIKSTGGQDLNRLLFVAYILDAPDAFSRISWEILIAQVGPFVKLAGLSEHELVPYSLLRDFIARKAQIDLSIVRAMEVPILHIKNCRNFSGSAGAYISKLKDNGLWPLEEQSRVRSISGICEQITNMPEISTTICPSSYCECRSISLANVLKKGMEKIRGIKGGLCLDCVKAHGKLSGENECRLCIPKL